MPYGWFSKGNPTKPSDTRHYAHLSSILGIVVLKPKGVEAYYLLWGE